LRAFDARAAGVCCDGASSVAPDQEALLGSVPFHLRAPRPRGVDLDVSVPGCTWADSFIHTLADGPRSGWTLWVDLVDPRGGIEIRVRPSGGLASIFRLTPGQAALLLERLSEVAQRLRSEAPSCASLGAGNTAAGPLVESRPPFTTAASEKG
jgi:hypothetical protein